jgi:hypothetical protein
MADLQVKIAERDVPDFYRMLRDFRRERGNTFGYLEKELEKMYPKLKKQYEDNDNGLNIRASPPNGEAAYAKGQKK